MKKFRMAFIFMVFAVFAFAADNSDNIQNIYDPNYTPPPSQEQFYGTAQPQQYSPPPTSEYTIPKKQVPGVQQQPTPFVTPVQTQQPQTQNGSEQDPNAVVVTARKIPEILDFVPRNIEIIPGKEIDILNTVADVLNARPGIFVNRTSGFEGVSTISLRGASSEQALVMIDGVPINDIATGSADLTGLETAGIQKIEIVRGGVSSIYGADAMAGVVNILTDPIIKKIITAGAYYGTYNTQKQLLSSSYQIANLKYAVNAVQESSDGYMENSGYFKRVIDGKIKFNSDASDTVISGYYLNREQGVPGTIDYLSPNNKQYDENYDIGLSEALNLNPADLKLDGFIKSGT